MSDMHRNSDLVEMGVEEIFGEPEQSKAKKEPKKQKEEASEEV
jgi:hypothetical protein